MQRSTTTRAFITHALSCAAAIATLSIGTIAFAQPRDDHDRHGPDRRGSPPPRVVEERGAGPDHNFHRGGRLSPEYRNHQYVVDDWRAHQLRQPPRGYHWVQTGGDYVLAAIATGVIADILLNH
jgi:Ni/Co efflux regulator RcnB